MASNKKTGKGSVQTQAGQDEAIILGDSANLQTGGVAITSSGNGSVSVMTADPQIASAALGVVSSVANGSQSFASQVLQQLTQHQTDAIKSLNSLAESKQTDGESERNKMVVFIVVALVIGWIFTKRA